MLVGKTDHIEVLFVDRGTKELLVTFNEINTKANGFDYWGKELAEKAQLSILGFVSTEPNWFPAPDMRHLSEITADIRSRFERRVLFGHSQGGYAALKYGNLLSATHTIAFCPQATIEQDIISKFDGRYTSHFNPKIHMDMSIREDDLGENNFVFFDPFDSRDRRHIELMSGFFNKLNLIQVPMTGHDTIRAFTGTEIFINLFNLCLSEHTSQIKKFAIERRKSSPLRYRFASHMAEHRHQKWSDAIIEKYKSKVPHYYLVWMYFIASVHSLRRKQIDRAMVMIDLALAISPNNEMFISHRENIFAATKFTQT